MAGRPKGRIDYSGWSVDIFDNDTKIDKLLDAYGWRGFGIYFYLCQRAYGADGYFYRWSYDDCATTAKRMGGGIGAETVREVVTYCFSIGLFSRGLFDKWGILTSKGIQRCYWNVISKRRVRIVYREYWLLHDYECQGLVKVSLNSDFNDLQPTNGDLQPTNGELQTQKRSEVKRSEVKGSKSPPALAEIEAYCAQQGYRYIDPKKFYLHYESTGWRNMHNWQASVDKWEIEDRERAQKAKPAGNNRFNNFQQRTYTQDELDRLMIRG